MNGLMNQKLLFVLGPITALLMFGGVVLVVSLLLNREYQGALPGACRDRRPHAPRRGTGRREGRCGGQGTGDALRGSPVPKVPGRREPRRDLGGRATPPPVRGLRPGGSDLRVHHRGDRLQDR